MPKTEVQATQWECDLPTCKKAVVPTTGVEVPDGWVEGRVNLSHKGEGREVNFVVCSTGHLKVFLDKTLEAAKKTSQ